MDEDRKLISVIIPVYNTKKEFILETLSSVANQTLSKKDYEIVMVDDCSNDSKTRMFLEELNCKDNFDGISFKMIRHRKNLWLSESRKTGAKFARGKYIIFLDSDDLIKEDYLKKAILLLETTPRAGWVYPNVRKFGHYDYFAPARKFNAYSLFFNNFCPASVVFSRSAWLKVSQREIFVTKKIRFFEDWDTLIRLMAKGWYGLHLRDSEFLYRTHHNSLITRTPKLYAMSIYTVWRNNIFSFIGLFKSQLNYLKNLRKGSSKSFFDLGLINSFVLKRVGQTYHPGFITPKLFLYSIFKPKKFIREFLDTDSSMSIAEALCGFYRKPHFDFSENLLSNEEGGKIFFVHPFWRIGGAENILLDWIKAIKDLDLKIIEVVTKSNRENNALKNDFLEYVDEQYALDNIGETPLQKLKFCWNLIVKERPKVIFISSSCFFYALIPLIKKRFPSIKIIDILHNEEILDYGGWYAVSDEYKNRIDKRIVTSQIWKSVLVEKYKEKNEKIVVCNNLIDTGRFDPKKYDKNKIRKSLDIDTEKFVIGFIGRLSEQKNPLVFLKLAELFREDDRFQFVMVGNYENSYYKKMISEKIDSLSNLRYFGYSNEIPRFMSICDLLVFPSKYEGYPLVGLEAAAMNIPIVATDIVGFREQVDLGKFGFLYQQVDNLTDAQKIKDLILYNKEEFTKIGKNGREFVLKHHDVNECNDKYRKLIELLI